MPPYKYNLEEETTYWYVHHNGYHITERKNLPRIEKYGLRPRNGDRCKRINDERKGIFCTDNIYGIKCWIEWLYPDVTPEELVLLKFDLKHRKVHFKEYEDLYLGTKVLPNSLSCLEIFYQEKKVSLELLLEALYNEKDYRLEWHPLLQKRNTNN